MQRVLVTVSKDTILRNDTAIFSAAARLRVLRDGDGSGGVRKAARLRFDDHRERHRIWLAGKPAVRSEVKHVAAEPNSPAVKSIHSSLAHNIVALSPDTPQKREWTAKLACLVSYGMD
jgi:hypothetical protein